MVNYDDDEFAEFMSRVEGREDTVGEPVFWAQWPSKEKK